MVVGAGTLQRGDGPGWRFSDGILVFGGWLDDDEVDATDAVHLGNDYTNRGGFKD